MLDEDKKWTDDDAKLEVAPYGPETIRSNRDFYIHTLLRILGENANDDSENEQPTIIFSVMLTRLLLSDAKLDSRMISLLQAKCCRDSGDDTLNCLEKREPRTVKKVKFHCRKSFCELHSDRGVDRW